MGGLELKEALASLAEAEELVTTINRVLRTGKPDLPKGRASVSYQTSKTYRYRQRRALGIRIAQIEVSSELAQAMIYAGILTPEHATNYNVISRFAATLIDAWITEQYRLNRSIRRSLTPEQLITKRARDNRYYHAHPELREANRVRMRLRRHDQKMHK
jgi:hypothetical protein